MYGSFIGALQSVDIHITVSFHAEEDSSNNVRAIHTEAVWMPCSLSQRCKKTVQGYSHLFKYISSYKR